jgi:ParB-like chromosome segregation protein Spo0J
MEIKKLPIDKIKLAEYNPRKDLNELDEEYQKLKRSIEEFGYVSPIIVNQKNNTVIGGHQRYKVLKDLGHKEILCVVVDFDENQEMLLNIALNKIQGDWDMEKLEELLMEFKEEGLDATITGFSEDEIDDLLGAYGEAEDDSDAASKDNDDYSMIVCPKCQHVDEEEEFKI